MRLRATALIGIFNERLSFSLYRQFVSFRIFGRTFCAISQKMMILLDIEGEHAAGLASLRRCYPSDGGSTAHALDMTSSAALQVRRGLAASSTLATWPTGFIGGCFNVPSSRFCLGQ
jgi:hypothetical protein